MIMSLRILVNGLPKDGPVQPSNDDRLEVSLVNSIAVDYLIADSNRHPVLRQLQTRYFPSSIPLPDRVG